MGQYSGYICKECGFRVSSEGPSSRGFRYRSKCFKCNDCNWVGDKHISIDSEWSESVPTCSSCSSTNLSEWNFKCPTCNIDMKHDANVEIEMRD